MTLFDIECHHECFFLRIGCLFVQSLFVRISGLHEIPLYNKTPSVVVLTPCTFPPVILKFFYFLWFYIFAINITKNAERSVGMSYADIGRHIQ